MGTTKAKAKRASAATAQPVELPTRLLTQREAAELLNMSPRTLEGRRTRGAGPPFVKSARRAQPGEALPGRARGVPGRRRARRRAGRRVVGESVSLPGPLPVTVEYLRELDRECSPAILSGRRLEPARRPRVWRAGPARDGLLGRRLHRALHGHRTARDDSRSRGGPQGGASHHCLPLRAGCGLVQWTLCSDGWTAAPPRRDWRARSGRAGRAAAPGRRARPGRGAEARGPRALARGRGRASARARERPRRR